LTTLVILLKLMYMSQNFIFVKFSFLLFKNKSFLASIKFNKTIHKWFSFGCIFRGR
jgi:hypothetical protein